MTASQLKSEQKNVDTIARLINERYAYLDALVKICEMRLKPIDAEAKADRMIEIAEKTLETWK